MHSPMTIRFAALAALPLLAGLAGCGIPDLAARPDGGAPKLDFTLGTLVFHVSSQVVVTGVGSLTFYFTDQAEGCQAISFTPRARVTTLSIQINPPADGSTHATITSKSVAAAGEATATLLVKVQGAKVDGLTPTSGAIAWTPYNDGTGRQTVTALDVSFAETQDRLTITGGLTVLACKP